MSVAYFSNPKSRKFNLFYFLSSEEQIGSKFLWYETTTEKCWGSSLKIFCEKLPKFPWKTKTKLNQTKQINKKQNKRT